MRHALADSVVVITGASSGIGRATAHEFANKGAKLCLVARRADVLADVVAECEQRGGQAFAIAADTTNEEALMAVAGAVVERHGRLDVWVNNAAVIVYGLFEDTPADAFRRVMETNFFGYVHGARAALRHFRQQGRGVLINNASIVSRFSEPYVTSYVASKHAVRGLGQSLRQELALQGADDIHVCTVMPATIDTPFFQHAANLTGHQVRAMPPVYPPERVARTIVGLARNPRREAFVGNAGRQFGVLSAVAPRTAERALARMAEKGHLSRENGVPRSMGNLFQPAHDHLGVTGGWKPRGTARALRGLAIVATVVGLPLLGKALLRRRPISSKRMASRLADLVA